MPEVPDFFASKAKDSSSDELIRWHTVTYRTVAVWLIIVMAVVGTLLTILYPQWWRVLLNTVSGKPAAATHTAGDAARKARFTNLEGSVRVRKANQVQWTAATVSMDLEQGDTVQTLRDGLARIAFADGALFVVKPDTLIVLEADATRSDDRTLANVAVQVTSGVVDLSTSRGAGDSRVRFANAEARIYQQSRAMVTNNPETNLHQITISKGGARVTRGGEQLELGEYEQASFAGPETRMAKTKIVAPPILLTPANAAPVVMSGASSVEVEFTWSAIRSAESYRLRISSSPIFSTMVYDRRLQSTSVRLPSFKAGDYYWSVASLGAGNKESQPSDANKFSVIRQDNGGEILLIADRYIQHGRVIEIIGRTEPGATVLVNNEPVFNIAPDGKFKHFTAPLPNIGANQITMTAQNRKGKVATLRKTITIQ
ncbi:MAG: hypothetical protein HYX72_06805 [Acidobacteria bacterium]|nr:hypothetical protein [Acidobacteriota bacterium]